MAFVETYEASLVLKDSAGDVATKRLKFNPATVTTVAQAITALDNLIAALTPLTKATLFSYSVVVKNVENAFTYPVGGVEVEDRALVVCPITDKPESTYTMDIPAPIDALFIAGSGPQRNIVNTTNAALLGYGAYFGATGSFVVSDGDTLVQPYLTGHRSKAGGRG